MHQILHQAFFWEATEEKSHCLLHRSPLALLLDLCELLLNKIVVSSTSSRENSNEIHCKGNILLCEDLDQILSGKEIRGKGNIPLRSEPVCDIPYVIIDQISRELQLLLATFGPPHLLKMRVSPGTHLQSQIHLRSLPLRIPNLSLP